MRRTKISGVTSPKFNYSPSYEKKQKARTSDQKYTSECSTAFFVRDEGKGKMCDKAGLDNSILKEKYTEYNGSKYMSKCNNKSNIGALIWKVVSPDSIYGIYLQNVLNFITKRPTYDFSNITNKLDVYLSPIRSRIPFADYLLIVIFCVLFCSFFVLFIQSIFKLKKQQENLGKCYVENRMTVEEFSDRSYTAQQIASLMMTPEYRKLRESRGRDTSQWNWQKRCEVYPEDETDLWGNEEENDGDSDNDNCYDKENECYNSNYYNS